MQKEEKSISRLIVIEDHINIQNSRKYVYTYPTNVGIALFKLEADDVGGLGKVSRGTLGTEGGDAVGASEGSVRGRRFGVDDRLHVQGEGEDDAAGGVVLQAQLLDGGILQDELTLADGQRRCLACMYVCILRRNNTQKSNKAPKDRAHRIHASTHRTFLK